MGENFWRISAFILGGLLLILFIVVGILSYKLAVSNKNKTKEINERLSTQELELKSLFQKEKEQVLNEYTADEVFGLFKFSYPKVWYTNVTKTEGAKQELVFLGHPDQIVNDKENPPYTALRVVVFRDKYANKVKEFNEDFKGTEATISGMSGTKYTGQDEESKKQITFYILPLRDKTLYIGTDDIKYTNEFNQIVSTIQLNK